MRDQPPWVIALCLLAAWGGIATFSLWLATIIVGAITFALVLTWATNQRAAKKWRHSHPTRV